MQVCKNKKTKGFALLLKTRLKFLQPLFFTEEFLWTKLKNQIRKKVRNAHVCFTLIVDYWNWNFKLNFKTGVNDQNAALKISNSVASHVCGQHSKYQESNSIQNPVQNRPENDDAKCGWLIWTKSGSESECGTSKYFNKSKKYLPVFYILVTRKFNQYRF